MATLKELREARLHKLEQLKNLGIDAYPAISKKDYSNKIILDKFEELEGKEVSVTGKIFSIRGHGKLSFIDIKDASSMLQLVLKETDVFTLGELDPSKNSPRETIEKIKEVILKILDDKQIP